MIHPCFLLNALRVSNLWKQGENSALRLLRQTLIVQLHYITSGWQSVLPPVSPKIKRVMLHISRLPCLACLTSAWLEPLVLMTNYGVLFIWVIQKASFTLSVAMKKVTASQNQSTGKMHHIKRIPVHVILSYVSRLRTQMGLYIPLTTSHSPAILRFLTILAGVS